MRFTGRSRPLGRGETPDVDFPAGDLDPGVPFDVAFDGHTGEGARLDRGTRFFTTHGARVGPEGEDEQSARWQRLAMTLDDEVSYADAELDHAVEPVDPDDPWTEPDEITETTDAGGADGATAEDAEPDADESVDGSLADFSE